MNIIRAEIEEMFQKCVDKWGIPTQIKMVIEECSELITVLCKFDRKINGSTIHDITKEIADVELMLDQLKFMLRISNEQVEQEYNKKLDRLKNYLQNLNIHKCVECGEEIDNYEEGFELCSKCANA